MLGCAVLSACGGGGSSGSAGLCQSNAASTGVSVQLNMPLATTSLLRARPAGLRPGARPATTSTLYPYYPYYTPEDIRLAYQEPAAPSQWSNLSATQAASFGAGQTIYVFDIYSAPDLAEELNYFSQTWGLPTCPVVSIPVTQPMPLPAASAGAGCTFSLIHVSASGTMTPTPPASSAEWAGETAVDVEWAHASAPLARLIEVNSNPPDGAAALALIDTMGPGILSMSMDVSESAGMVDDVFDDADMSYVSAAGDWGPNVYWPGVMPQVLTVGGTTLDSYTSTSRQETVWSTTGGGISQFVTAPSYQLGLGLGMRSVPDVSLNAGSGQIMVLLSPGASAPGGGDVCAPPPSSAVPTPLTAPSAPAGPCPPSWRAVAGTSISTPEWAGMLAVADARRALSGLAPLGLVQPRLYALLQQPSLYARVFQDITAGSNGTCSTCSAGIGFDVPTGLGTPNVDALLNYLVASPVRVAPIVTSLSVSGQVGQALSFGVPYSAVQPVTWALSAAPAGMVIGTATGVVSWPHPVAGSYQVTVTATDPQTLLSGSATLSVSVPANGAPSIASASVSGLPGQPFSYALQVGDPQLDPLSFSISGAPFGMTVDARGVLTWASPLPGSYSPTVTVRDTTSGQSASATIQARFANVTTGPLLTGNAPRAIAGQALSTVLATLADPAATQARITITGAVSGMNFRVDGQSVLLSWPDPQCGSYTLTLTATDSLGLSSQARVLLHVAAS